MPRSAAQIDPASLVNDAGRKRALENLTILVRCSEQAETRRKADLLLGRGLKAWKRGDYPKAAKFALKAVKEDETFARGFHLLAMAMERMGHLHKALAMYERAFALDPHDSDLILDLGLSAMNQKMLDWAEKMFRLYIEARPDSPLGYNNLGGLLCKSGRVSEGIETLRAAIFRMPEHAILWNTLATSLAEDGRCEESLVFYQEGIRLDPKFPRAWHNLGYAYSHLGRLEEAMDCYEKALSHAATEAERIETRHSRSLCLIGMGRIAEGFREYEIRNHPHFRDHVHYMTKAPRWDGEPLKGKRLLAISEQGLGDEIMFASVLPDLAQAVGETGKLEIAVDRRLIGLFQRSFPQAIVGTYADRKLTDKEGNTRELRFVPWATESGDPDYYVPVGSALKHFRNAIEDFPKTAFLVPDPARVAQYRQILQSFGTSLCIGICWRSMLLAGKRHKYYSALDLWGPILKTPDVTFVNLQYGDCAEELQRAVARHGVDIKIIEGLDLKDDIDGAAALSAALDLVISAPTAAAATAASVGTPVWFLTAGRTWPQLGTGYFPWYRESRVFCPEKFGDWNTVIPRVAEALGQLPKV